MMSGNAGAWGAAGAISLLLDVLPVLLAIILAIAFIRNRKARREEEAELRKAIAEFSAETAEDNCESIDEDDRV